MKENKILSAEEFMNSEQFEPDTGICFEDYHGDVSLIVPTMMIEFAKLHVKAALERASEKADIRHKYYDKWDDNELYEKYKDDGFQRTDEDGIPYGVDITTINKQSILSSYPEELIK